MSKRKREKRKPASKDRLMFAARMKRWKLLFAVAEAHDDIVQFFVGDEAAAVSQFVAVDGFRQFRSIGIRVLAGIAELPAFGQSFRPVASGIAATILKTFRRLSGLLDHGLHAKSSLGEFSERDVKNAEISRLWLRSHVGGNTAVPRPDCSFRRDCYHLPQCSATMNSGPGTARRQTGVTG